MNETLIEKIIDFKDRYIILANRYEVVDIKKYSLPNKDSNKMYCFNNYDDFLNYFYENNIDLGKYEDEISLDNVIYLTSKTGKIYATKFLCDYTIDFLRAYDEAKTNSR